MLRARRELINKSTMFRTNSLMLLVLFSLLCFFATFSQCANVTNNRLYPSLNLSRAGICTLEVPTIDLLSPQDRLSASRPQGNGSRPGFSKIEICCSGWARKSHNHYECEPVCDGGCENGNCTAPNVCTCKRGHIENPLLQADLEPLTPNHPPPPSSGHVPRDPHCIPTCPIGCLHGVCTNHGVCSCNAGHQLSADGKYCVPVCSGGCGIGGDCVGAEACRCRPGFSLNRQNNKCEHHCEGGCGPGTCAAPNKCSCPPGYATPHPSGAGCLASCPRGCRNGACSAPDTCTCPPRWTASPEGGECVAHCSHPCLNGDCTAPDTCTCKRGYAADPLSATRSKCLPLCEGGCENGFCTSPNFCLCNPGFVKEAKGGNRCVRRLRRAAEGWMHFELIPDQAGRDE